MPRSGPKLAEEGRIRDDSEYIEWARRVSLDVEDVLASWDEDLWREHVNKKYPPLWRSEFTETQFRGLWDKGITGMFKTLPEAGFTTGTSWPRGIPHTFYRDVKTGRFVSYRTVAERMGWKI